MSLGAPSAKPIHWAGNHFPQSGDASASRAVAVSKMAATNAGAAVAYGSVWNLSVSLLDGAYLRISQAEDGAAI